MILVKKSIRHDFMILPKDWTFKARNGDFLICPHIFTLAALIY